MHVKMHADRTLSARSRAVVFYRFEKDIDYEAVVSLQAAGLVLRLCLSRGLCRPAAEQTVHLKSVCTLMISDSFMFFSDFVPKPDPLDCRLSGHLACRHLLPPPRLV
jgi:hypothetical protein